MLFDKQSEKRFIAGIELRKDAVQISYGFEKGGHLRGEPVTYTQTSGREDFDLPATLCRVPSGEWYCGSEASLHAADAGCVYIPGILSLALERVPVSADGRSYAAEDLLARYLVMCLQEVQRRIGEENSSGRGSLVPAAIMFTAREVDSRLLDLVESLKERMNLQASVYCQTTASAFYDFMLSQEEELRGHGTALFEYETGGKLLVHKLLFDPHTRPVVSYMEENEYPGLFAEDATGRDQEFAAILKNELTGHHFDSVYLTGSGFKGDWMKRSARLACQGRRAFAGSNLFSKGAVYGAAFKLERPKILEEYLFLDQNKLRSNVLIEVSKRGKSDRICVVDAGVNWYEVQASTELILDATAEIELVLRPLAGGKEVPYHIRLDRLPVREGRMTRVRLVFTMTAPDKMLLRMEDLGFGEIFPSSGLKWEQHISLQKSR